MASGVLAMPGLPDALHDARESPGPAGASVISGVRSSGLSPVPPLVMTTAGCWVRSARIAAPTGSPSGTTMAGNASKPCSVSQSMMTGPVSSS